MLVLDSSTVVNKIYQSYKTRRIIYEDI
ncbi:unnamed protein product [Leptidea sinapis]|uniref:Uncharacterized protein n=1 Tax=Leptidea sinapis TaxID=189913 RepID=A0A5E4R1V8_9NEOP|nr:unnamed protein product [Leptidea sinapis]